MNPELLKVALRQNAIFIPDDLITEEVKQLNEETAIMIADLAHIGYGVSENLLHALNHLSTTGKSDILNVLTEISGIKKNWTPLVKGWDTPTGESINDHLVTFFANIFGGSGTTLECGHLIPYDTFPLERYNGCPFCGTPFIAYEIEKVGQGSKKKILEHWKNKDLLGFYKDLLESKTALDATQMDSLKILLSNLQLPEAEIGMKETTMAVIDFYVSHMEYSKAQILFKSPADIMRYLWYKQTGFLQIIEPRTIIKRFSMNYVHVHGLSDKSIHAEHVQIQKLKLKFSRPFAFEVAKWINDLPLPPDKSCEIMHAKRNMWVRFIRALRLAEFCQVSELRNLKTMLDLFYNKKYEVWSGHVYNFRLKKDAAKTFKLLKERPGMFARSLFANMLWFGPEETLKHFEEVIDKVPARLIFTLNMYAKNYFSTSILRTVKPLGGVSKTIPPNQKLFNYDQAKLQEMILMIEDLCLIAIRKRFSAIKNDNKTIYIDPLLFYMPVSIGDRSENIQDLPVSLMGTRFKVEGSKVRLFMQWGNDLPAQHLDMDLSCQIAFDDKYEICSYSNIVATGCMHSGDIRQIPEKIGTAEYIEINVDELHNNNARFVTFTCNAYSVGSITPNLIVGWMNSSHPMVISAVSGVAYDPSCVQHQVRITQSLTKGLVFGVLDVVKREIIWLEMPFQGQVVGQLDTKGVHALLAKLNAKLSIGNLLKIKAESQGMKIIEEKTADEVYDFQWGKNAAGVTRLLVD